MRHSFFCLRHSSKLLDDRLGVFALALESHDQTGLQDLKVLGLQLDLFMQRHLLRDEQRQGGEKLALVAEALIPDAPVRIEAKAIALQTKAQRLAIMDLDLYMDAIAAHQAGFKNVVAQMGTALTEYQVDEIRRLTPKLTMALDQDAAGQAATLRSLDVILERFRTKAVNNQGPDGSPQASDPDPRITPSYRFALV